MSNEKISTETIVLLLEFLTPFIPTVNGGIPRFASVVTERLKDLQALHDYLEQPDVLMSIPQPHRLKISELLHGEHQTFATDPENL